MADAYAAYLNIPRAELLKAGKGTLELDGLSVRFLKANRVVPFPLDDGSFALSKSNPLDDFAHQALPRGWLVKGG